MYIKKSTKSLIIDLLGTNFPLSLTQIYKEIIKTKIISYQAVHKTIKELVEEKILEKFGKQYLLNKEWVHNQTKQFTNHYANYFNLSYNANQIDTNSKIQVFRFSSIKELTDFLIDAYSKDYFKLEGKLYFSVRKLLPFIPQTIIQFIKQVLKNNKICVLCRGNGISDKVAAKFYRALGINVKTGVTLPHYNSALVGNCVMQYFFFFNDSYRTKLYSYSEKIKQKTGFSLMKMTSDIIYKKIEIFIVINRHPVLVSDMKQSLNIYS